MNSAVTECTVGMTEFMTTNEPSILLILPNIIPDLLFRHFENLS